MGFPKYDLQCVVKENLDYLSNKKKIAFDKHQLYILLLDANIMFGFVDRKQIKLVVTIKKTSNKQYSLPFSGFLP